MENSIIAILAWNVAPEGPISVSNRTVWYLNWVQTNELGLIELFEIELLICVKKWLMFNWIVSDT